MVFLILENKFSILNLVPIRDYLLSHSHFTVRMALVSYFQYVNERSSFLSEEIFFCHEADFFLAKKHTSWQWSVMSFSSFLLHWWRITDSNRWPPACKAGALASWANPPVFFRRNFSVRRNLPQANKNAFSLKMFKFLKSLRRSPVTISFCVNNPNNFQLWTFNVEGWRLNVSSPERSWTADLYIISVAL